MTSALSKGPPGTEPAIFMNTLSCFLCGEKVRAVASASTREFLLKLKRSEVAFLICADCFGEASAEVTKRRRARVGR